MLLVDMLLLESDFFKEAKGLVFNCSIGSIGGLLCGCCCWDGGGGGGGGFRIGLGGVGDEVTLFRGEPGGKRFICTLL